MSPRIQKGRRVRESATWTGSHLIPPAAEDAEGLAWVAAVDALRELNLDEAPMWWALIRDPDAVAVTTADRIAEATHLAAREAIYKELVHQSPIRYRGAADELTRSI